MMVPGLIPWNDVERLRKLLRFWMVGHLDTSPNRLLGARSPLVAKFLVIDSGQFLKVRWSPSVVKT